MRIQEGESYESWCDRVRMYEHGWAMQQVAEGKDVDKILEEMSRRITEKLLHPVFVSLRSSVPYDVEASKQRYKELYLDKNLPKADHVDGQIIDEDLDFLYK